MRALLIFLLLSAAGYSAEVLGTQPSEWTVREWLNSEPLTLTGLRGKVVVVRWWTGPNCPFCAGTAPVLNALWKDRQARDLMVIGMYHHKEATPLTREHVVAQMKRLGIEFPVGIDKDWKTLRRWWLTDDHERRWTSVTFVLDRAGRVVHVHPGGEIAEGSADARDLRAAVERALAGK